MRTAGGARQAGGRPFPSQRAPGRGPVPRAGPLRREGSASSGPARRGDAQALAHQPAGFGDLGPHPRRGRRALAREVRSQFQRRGVRKIYQALVFGKAETSFRDMAGRPCREEGGRPDTGRRRRGEPARGVPDDARADGLRRDPRVDDPPRAQTGRSHQLRVQCASRGLPIVGDRTYGDFAANRGFVKGGGAKRMFLHSLEVSFEYSLGGREHPFSARAPLPPEFESLG
jgi:hypothetical protein